MIRDDNLVIVETASTPTPLTGDDVVGYIDLLAGYEGQTHLVTPLGAWPYKNMAGENQPRTVHCRYGADPSGGKGPSTKLELVFSPVVTLDDGSEQILATSGAINGTISPGDSLTGIHGAQIPPTPDIYRYLGLRVITSYAGSLVGLGLECSLEFLVDRHFGVA